MGLILILTAVRRGTRRMSQFVEDLLTCWGRIIFAHGLGCNLDPTWTIQTRHSKSSATDMKDIVSWISDFLPQDLRPSIHEHTRVFFYNHDSYWQRDAVQTRLWSLDEGLLHRIRVNIRNSQ